MHAQLAHKFNVKSALEHCDAYLSKRAADDFNFLRLGTVRLPCLSCHHDHALSAAWVLPIVLAGCQELCSLLLLRLAPVVC